MNWDAFGAIAESVGAIAVVISLLYLALQLRRNSQISKATIRSEISQSAQNILISSAGHSDAIVKILTGEKLSPKERFELTMFNRASFRAYENFFYQKKLGLFDDSEWDGYMAAVSANLSQPFTQEDWRAVREQYSKGLQQIIDPMVPDVNDKSQTPTYVLGRTVRGNEERPNKSFKQDASDAGAS
jgi:hypothetical protein